MLTPAEARARMLAAVRGPVEAESIAIAEGAGRVLAEDLAALLTQPPCAVSAMDGYAVRCEDMGTGRPLAVIGEAAAGRPFAGRLQRGTAIRIFTGAEVPQGADTILIQENAEASQAGLVQPRQEEARGRFVRPAGLDFKTGDVLLHAGMGLDPRRLGLAASMGHGKLPVRRRPRMAILSTGDELVAPGQAPGPGQIISSNALALSALAQANGAVPLDHGIVPDREDETRAAIIRAAAESDLVITCGGASVGDHDHVRAALTGAGFSIDFWRVAVRPGKPLMLGVRGPTLCIGLPGNPVSSMVCALLFVRPVLRALLGQPQEPHDGREPAVIGAALPANDGREDYMRASLHRDASGGLVAIALSPQDSSMQHVLARADALLIRPPHAPAAVAGEACEIMRL
jgi:molybdopterin molybdotransferase